MIENFRKKVDSTVINTDTDSYARAKSRKKQKESIEKLEQRISVLEKQLSSVLERICDK